jgi:hypothetical protein
MNNEPPKHSKLSHLPGILAAAAALIAAVSTLYVNMRSSSSTPEPATAASVATPLDPATAATVAAATPAAPEPRALLLRLDRVQVENDGSMGTTDWTFEVSAAGEPRFTLPMRALNDKPGHNLARPADPAQAVAELMLAPDQQLQVGVKGWKEGLLSGGAEVSGTAWVSGKPGNTSIHVASDAPKSPAFTLYFTVAPRP